VSQEKKKPLRDKIALVTGAGRGIGRAIALGYAAAGAAVCCAARTASEIKETVTEIEVRGGTGLAVPTDVTQPEQVTHLVQSCVAQLGGLHILVLNAGINTDRRPIAESVIEDWQATIKVNLFGAYYCARAAIPHLRAQSSGVIITIGSGLGHRPKAELGAYAAAKAGLWSLTRTLAQELAPDNISVNELIPGPVVTSLTAGLAERQDSVFGIEGEWVKAPEDVVSLALFLATQPPIGPTAQSFSLMRRAN
jgi:3-oxoacyl-[acyl-carrier protein] reductase